MSISNNPVQPLDQPKDDCVRERYSTAAQQQEPALCCPVNYDAKLLAVIPDEVIERDYGCGDPSPYVRLGETVVDLGAGGGKLCFMISQLVGDSGSVIGVDINPEMLELARRVQPDVASKIGYDNIQFRCGRIQDLAIDHDQLAAELESVSFSGAEGALQLLQLPETMRRENPMIADSGVDCVVSNCVLNLVNPTDRKQLFAEIFRVLKPGGRAAISDIVSDQDVPAEMQANPELWSGCISGAWREDLFLDEFANAGFVGMTIDKREPRPWQVVNGIEFRSVTVLAIKPAVERESDSSVRHSVIYRGPFAHVMDEGGNAYPRGRRMMVSGARKDMLARSPYRDCFHFADLETAIDAAGQGLPISGSCCGGSEESCC